MQVMYLSTQFTTSSLTLFHIEVHPSPKIMHVYEVTLFDHMVQLFIRDVLKRDEMPIGEIVDFFTEWNFNKVSSTGYRVLLNKI